MEKYMCWYAYEEPYVPHDTMIERIVELTSSSSNVHGVVDDNSNPYRNMVIDVIEMNQGHAGQYLIVDEEPNIDSTSFFDLLKDFDEPLWNRNDCTNYSKLSTIALMFTAKSDYGLSMVELSNRRETFYLKTTY
ncbi:hypothetical protein Peur_009194 [Populus x canadensis]